MHSDSRPVFRPPAVLFRAFVFGVALLLALGCSHAAAQGIAAAQQQASPATTTDPNAATLFPNGGAPAPELEENRQPAPGAGRRNRQRRGQRGASGRGNDVLSARAASDPLRVRIAFRVAKTEALLRHPELSILERQADAAPTDEQKRAFLRAYYTQLYSAVGKIDPSPEMTSHVRILSRIARQRYEPKRREVGGEEDLVRGGGGGGRGRRR